MPAVITTDFMNQLYVGLHALWADQFEAAKTTMHRDTLCTVVESETLEESYNWLGTVPKMTEWIGPRAVAGLSTHEYRIKNKDFANAIEVDRNTILDNRLQLIRPRIAQLVDEAIRFQDELVFQVLELGKGATGLCYDGQQFFDTDHVDPGADYTTIQSNRLTGTGTSVTALETDYNAARKAMRMFRDGYGRPMNIMPTHVVCHPALEGAFRKLLNSDTYIVVGGTDAGAAITNIWKGTADLIVSNYLTDENDWYLLSLNRPVKPLIFQMRQEPQFAARDRPDDPAVFDQKVFKYGADMRCNVGYGLWQLAVLTTNA
jgi:phage major head subunit gpT-like protein